MRYQLIPVRMVLIKKSTNDKCWGGCEEKGTVGGNANWYYCEEQYKDSYKTKNIATI